MTQAAGSLKLPLAHSLGGRISDQEEQTGLGEYFPYLQITMTPSVCAVWRKLSPLCLTWSLWLLCIVRTGLFSFCRKETKGERGYITYSRSQGKSWYSAFQFPCLSMAPCLREGDAQRSQQQYLLSTYCAPDTKEQNQVSALLELTRGKNVRTRRELPCVLGLTLIPLGVVISWLPSILEPHFPYL